MDILNYTNYNTINAREAIRRKILGFPSVEVRTFESAISAHFQRLPMSTLALRFPAVYPARTAICVLSS